MSLYNFREEERKCCLNCSNFIVDKTFKDKIKNTCLCNLKIIVARPEISVCDKHNYLTGYLNKNSGR